MKKRIVFLNIFCFAIITIYAQDTSFISLERLLQQVETNYPAILQYQQNIQSWQAKAQGAKSWMPPTFSTGIMRFPYNLSMVKEKNDPMNQAGIAFSIEQMIPNQTKLNAKRDYINSLAEVEKSKSELDKKRIAQRSENSLLQPFCKSAKAKTQFQKVKKC
jgi:cobalt-zinc-cadmium efflux system outer membrane protein